ncbi:MAG: hypothetical protein R3Y19_05020 [Rikenellaceae bacterium]
MINKEYLEQFEETLKQTLLRKCTSEGLLDGVLLESDDLDDIWTKFAPEYMADAVPLLNDYPSVAVAWGGYFGMAVASIWDTDWAKYKDSNLYSALREPRGFDEMDEYIIEEVLGVKLDSSENQKLEDLLRSMAQLSISQIRKEQIEAGTADAFYIFASAVKVVFKVGASLELYKRGYSYHKVDMNGLNNQPVS